MRNCRVHLGHTEERPLSRTFRFGKEILDPSSVFVQANPEQTRRDLRPADVSDDRGITIVADSTPSSTFLSAIGDIDELVGGDDQATVLVLADTRKPSAPCLDDLAMSAANSLSASQRSTRPKGKRRTMSSS